ncbi:MAG: GNAT family N-acetyltransferase [Acidimicrobiia bacterium]|nr:GNAT family N-acetyltransferase [Acidimicrobiia bacterium]
MDVEIRPPADEEADALFSLMREGFATPAHRFDRWISHTRFDRYLGAYVGGGLAGALEVLELGQWFGGRSIPMGGVASVAVAPEWRGQGLAPRLVTRAIHEMRARGEAISTLYPATTRLYRRLGWEVAGEHGVRTVPARSLASLPPGEPERLRRGSDDDLPLVRECYDRVAAGQNGFVDRPDSYWSRRLDLDRSDTYLYVCEAEGRVDGYVVYRQVRSRDGWGFGITVRELVAVDPAAGLALWRHLGSHAAQVETVTLLGGPADLLTLLLPEQDVAVKRTMGWMTRVVDASAAVAARGYPPGVRAEVHLEIGDRQAPWNDGPFVLDVEDGRGELRPGGTGDVRLAAHALAALYTGWTSARTLAAAGLVHHARDRDLAVLDAVFAGPRPWMFDEF